MARGGRTSLADLASAVGDNSTVQSEPLDGIFRRVSLRDVVANPDNPRDSLGNLEDLATIREKQLQPATAITRESWLKINPHHETELDTATYVVINGCRRLAAAIKYGADGFDIVIRDSLAKDPETILWAAIVENLDRRDFDVIEEARAVKQLVDTAGSATKVAERLGKSKGWISQRVALLSLAPELQQKLRDGELAIRDARSLAQVPRADQVAKWRALNRKEGEGSAPKPEKKPPAQDREVVRRALKRTAANPKSLAGAVVAEWSPGDIRSLIAALQKHVE
ncbi:ParB/RepB/Spo0J family partition protein [Gordonia alkanivorans]|uniref:ParB/RepB/Spo0J family partition protein n=1 Tax=Gordonia alkanivorans TaxID=84096 RepID=UPI0005A9CB7C